MFPARYYCARMFAARYFPKVGDDAEFVAGNTLVWRAADPGRSWRAADPGPGRTWRNPDPGRTWRDDGP